MPLLPSRTASKRGSFTDGLASGSAALVLLLEELQAALLLATSWLAGRLTSRLANWSSFADGSRLTDGSQTGAASHTGLQHFAFFPQKPPIPPVRARTRMTVFVTDALPKDTLDPGYVVVPNLRVCMANREFVYSLGRLGRMVRDF